MLVFPNRTFTMSRLLVKHRIIVGELMSEKIVLGGGCFGVSRAPSKDYTELVKFCQLMPVEIQKIQHMNKFVQAEPAMPK